MKKSLAFLTGICLALSSGLASAVTLNGWNVGNPTPVGAAGLVIASKSVGDVAKTSKALITPNASQVSKILRGGVAGVALTVAVNELLDGIDWVMDPANNQIRYKVITDGTVLYYRVFDGSANWINYPDLNSAYDAQFSKYCTTPASISSPWKLVAGNNIYDQTYKCGSSWFMIRRVDSADPSQTEKTLPLDTASQKIIDNAQSGNTDAQAVTVAAAQDILNEAENDAEKAKPIVQQLENNSTDLNPPVLLSKGRKQNIDNEYVRSVQNKENGDEDPCEWLKNLRNSEPDKAIKKKIKTAEKRFNCDGKNRFDKN